MFGKAYAAFSFVTATAIVATPQSVEENLNWLIRAFFGITIAIITYLLKQVNEQRIKDRQRLAKVEKQAGHHNMILKLWIEHIGQDIDSRNGKVGRRDSDVALANLLTAIRGVQEEDENGTVAD